MQTQMRSTKMLNLLKYLYLNKVKGYDVSELIYLIDPTIEDSNTEEIYDRLVGTYQPIIKAIKVKTIKELERARNSGLHPIDCQKINLKKECIENTNLENCNMSINLRELYIPNEQKKKEFPEQDLSFHLEKANLQGNDVKGDLTPLYYNGYLIYFSYAEDTFDETYKKRYEKFFLDKNAPQSLKRIYYQPKYCTLINAEGKMFSFYERNSLDFKEYLKYYSFLKGKYLGNFKISEKDKIIIRLVETYGLEETKRIVEKAANVPHLFYKVASELLKIPNLVPQEEQKMNKEETEYILARIKECQEIVSNE